MRRRAEQSRQLRLRRIHTDVTRSASAESSTRHQVQLLMSPMTSTCTQKCLSTPTTLTTDTTDNSVIFSLNLRTLFISPILITYFVKGICPPNHWMKFNPSTQKDACPRNRSRAVSLNFFCQLQHFTVGFCRTSISHPSPLLPVLLSLPLFPPFLVQCPSL